MSLPTKTKMTSLVGNVIQAEIGAPERWPSNVKLYEPYQAEQIILPDHANCLGVRTFLKMCNLPFTRELRINAEEMSPSGSVPFLQAGVFLVAEFDPIVAFVGLRGFQLSKDLSDTEKSDLRAYCSMVSRILGNAEKYLSWMMDTIAVEVTQPRVGAVHPWPLNWMIPMLKKSEVKSQLKSLGWADKTLEEDIFASQGFLIHTASHCADQKPLASEDDLWRKLIMIKYIFFMCMKYGWQSVNRNLFQQINQLLVSKYSKKKVCDEIKSCCQALSDRLEQQKYFFGDHPTELDALVFGHLFSLLTIELPAVDIAADIKEFVNLTEFCQRIEAIYFKEKEDD